MDQFGRFAWANGLTADAGFTGYAGRTFVPAKPDKPVSPLYRINCLCRLHWLTHGVHIILFNRFTGKTGCTILYGCSSITGLTGIPGVTLFTGCYGFYGFPVKLVNPVYLSIRFRQPSRCFKGFQKRTRVAGRIRVRPMAANQAWRCGFVRSDRILECAP